MNQVRSDWQLEAAAANAVRLNHADPFELDGPLHGAERLLASARETAGQVRASCAYREWSANWSTPSRKRGSAPRGPHTAHHGKAVEDVGHFVLLEVLLG